MRNGFDPPPPYGNFHTFFSFEPFPLIVINMYKNAKKHWKALKVLKGKSLKIKKC